MFKFLLITGGLSLDCYEGDDRVGWAKQSCQDGTCFARRWVNESGCFREGGCNGSCVSGFECVTCDSEDLCNAIACDGPLQTSSASSRAFRVGRRVGSIIGWTTNAALISRSFVAILSSMGIIKRSISPTFPAFGIGVRATYGTVYAARTAVVVRDTSFAAAVLRGISSSTTWASAQLGPVVEDTHYSSSSSINTTTSVREFDEIDWLFEAFPGTVVGSLEPGMTVHGNTANATDVLGWTGVLDHYYTMALSNDNATLWFNPCNARNFVRLGLYRRLDTDECSNCAYGLDSVRESTSSQCPEGSQSSIDEYLGLDAGSYVLLVEVAVLHNGSLTEVERINATNTTTFQLFFSFGEYEFVVTAARPTAAPTVPPTSAAPTRFLELFPGEVLGNIEASAGSFSRINGDTFNSTSVLATVALDNYYTIDIDKQDVSLRFSCGSTKDNIALSLTLYERLNSQSTNTCDDHDCSLACELVDCEAGCISGCEYSLHTVTQHVFSAYCTVISDSFDDYYYDDDDDDDSGNTFVVDGLDAGSYLLLVEAYQNGQTTINNEEAGEEPSYGDYVLVVTVPTPAPTLSPTSAPPSAGFTMSPALTLTAPTQLPTSASSPLTSPTSPPTTVPTTSNIPAPTQPPTSAPPSAGFTTTPTPAPMSPALTLTAPTQLPTSASSPLTSPTPPPTTVPTTSNIPAPTQPPTSAPPSAGFTTTPTPAPMSPALTLTTPTQLPTSASSPLTSPTPPPTTVPTTSNIPAPTQPPTSSPPSASPIPYPKLLPMSNAPTPAPTMPPTSASPSPSPTLLPTSTAPTPAPMSAPPSALPTPSPTLLPTSNAPTLKPTMPPTSASPTLLPTLLPTSTAPTPAPTLPPTSVAPSSAAPTRFLDYFPGEVLGSIEAGSSVVSGDTFNSTSVLGTVALDNYFTMEIETQDTWLEFSCESTSDNIVLSLTLYERVSFQSTCNDTDCSSACDAVDCEDGCTSGCKYSLQTIAQNVFADYCELTSNSYYYYEEGSSHDYGYYDNAAETFLVERLDVGSYFLLVEVYQDGQTITEVGEPSYGEYELVVTDAPRPRTVPPSPAVPIATATPGPTASEPTSNKTQVTSTAPPSFERESSEPISQRHRHLLSSEFAAHDRRSLRQRSSARRASISGSKCVRRAWNALATAALVLVIILVLHLLLSSLAAAGAVTSKPLVQNKTTTIWTQSQSFKLSSATVWHHARSSMDQALLWPRSVWPLLSWLTLSVVLAAADPAFARSECWANRNIANSAWGTALAATIALTLYWRAFRGIVCRVGGNAKFHAVKRDLLDRRLPRPWVQPRECLKAVSDSLRRAFFEGEPLFDTFKLGEWRDNTLSGCGSRFVATNGATFEAMHENWIYGDGILFGFQVLQAVTLGATGAVAQVQAILLTVIAGFDLGFVWYARPFANIASNAIELFKAMANAVVFVLLSVVSFRVYGRMDTVVFLAVVVLEVLVLALTVLLPALASVALMIHYAKVRSNGGQLHEVGIDHDSNEAKYGVSFVQALRAVFNDAAYERSSFWPAFKLLARHEAKHVANWWTGGTFRPCLADDATTSVDNTDASTDADGIIPRPPRDVSQQIGSAKSVANESTNLSTCVEEATLDPSLNSPDADEGPLLAPFGGYVPIFRQFSSFDLSDPVEIERANSDIVHLSIDTASPVRERRSTAPP